MIFNKKNSLTFCKKLLIPASLFLWVYFFAKYNFLKGFDFTDSTLSFHFSLRVLNGDIPFKDFHSTALPLTYYVGAFCHFLFGKSLLVNNSLDYFVNSFRLFLFI